MGPMEHLGTDWAQVFSKLTGLPLLMVFPWRPRPHLPLLDFLFSKKTTAPQPRGITIPAGLQVQPNARTALSSSNKPFTAFDTIQVLSSP